MRIVAAALLLSCIQGRSDAAWVQMGGPEPPVVSALFHDGSYYYLGSNESDAGEVFRSADGVDWSNAGLPNGGVTLIAAHAGRLFVGTYLTGLWSSIDAGSTWTEITSGLPSDPIIRGMAAVGGSLFLGIDGFGDPVYRSVDGGITWSAIPGSPSIRCASMAAFGSNIIIGLEGDGILRSTDGGTTWMAANAGIPSGAQVEALTEQSGTILAGVTLPFTPSGTGVYASTNGGSSWSKMSTDLPADTFTGISDLLAAGGSLYAALTGGAATAGVHRSTNGGVNWTPAVDGLPPGMGAQALLHDGVRLFCGTLAGAFRSMDGGSTWTRTDAGTTAIRGIAALLVEETALFVGLTSNGGVGSGIWRTTDHGATWTGDPSRPAVNSAANGVVRLGESLFAGLDGAFSGVVRSTDDGASWEVSSNGIPPSAGIRAIHEHQGVLLVGAWEALYRSTDAGASWLSVAGVSNVSCLASAGNDVYAGLYGDGIRRSTDAGATWTTVNGGLSSGSARTVNAIAPHQGVLYMASNGAGVWKLQGLTWVSAGLSNEFVYALLSVGGALVAGLPLDEKLRVTPDGGETWTPIDAGYTGGEVYELAADPQFLIVGSRGNGIWTLPRSELPGAAGVADGDATSPFSLRSHPNPYMEETTIRYVLPAAGEVDIRILDAAGRKVGEIRRSGQASGPHEARFDGSRLPAGVYFVRLRSGERTGSLRMIHAGR
jgi:hypothetical protein